MASTAGMALAAALLVGISGCADLGYYWRSASGHLQLMSAARPVDQLLADGAVAARLKERLALSQRMRSFAVNELKLPDNASYHRYADLGRSAAVWNVVAAPEFSLTLNTWCYPLTGCVAYRGYFQEAEARDEAARLAAAGYEASVYPVPAYSTLGWMNWAGGDPLLNTFIFYSDAELARLIFHELAHQVLYAKDDTTFNESFATAVERLGSARWLAANAPEAARLADAQAEAQRAQFRALAQATRQRLAGIYETKSLAAQDQRTKAAMKLIAMQEFRDRYAQLRGGWGEDPARFRGYDRWVAGANNAAFGAQAAYDELVPGFEALFEREGRDWQRFYDAAKRLAALPKAQRRQQLEQHQ